MTPACGRCGTRAVARINGARQCLACGQVKRRGWPWRSGCGGRRANREPCANGDHALGREVAAPALQDAAALGADRRAAGDGLGSPAVAPRSARAVGR